MGFFRCEGRESSSGARIITGTIEDIRSNGSVSKEIIDENINGIPKVIYISYRETNQGSVTERLATVFTGYYNISFQDSYGSKNSYNSISNIKENSFTMTFGASNTYGSTFTDIQYAVVV